MADINLGNLVRETRAQAHLSQRELAARAQTTQSVVGRIEAGLVTPTWESVERLLGAMGFELQVQLRPIAAVDPVTAAFKRDIDRTLIGVNLARTPEQRVRALQALARLADEAHRAGKASRRRATGGGE
jgi:transcriptional regulator with XRE-family HTH domain